MLFTTLGFWVIVFSYVCLYHGVRRLFRSEVVLLLFNLSVPLLFFGWDVLAQLVGYCLAGYLLLMARHKRRLSFALSALAVILAYTFLKRYFFWPAAALPTSLGEPVGVSYVVFRILNVLIDSEASREESELPPLAGFLNFCLAFPTLLSGPIQRYADFQNQNLSRQAFVLERSSFLAAVDRASTGLVKVVVVSPLLMWMHTSLQGGRAAENARMLLGPLAYELSYLGAAVLFLLFVYANFSGYTDVAISLGRLLGFTLPENFDRPFRAESFDEFFMRWHISLSAWFRDLFFTPLLKVLVSVPSLMRHGLACASFCLFITFLVLGIWHDRTAEYLVVGLLLGLGASTNKLYRAAGRSLMGRIRYREVHAHPLARLFQRGFTVMYISIAVTGAWMPLGEMLGLCEQVSPWRAVLALLAACIGCGTASTALPVLQSWLSSAMARMCVPTRLSEEGRAILEEGRLALYIALTAAVVLVESDVIPEFTYQGF